MTKPKTKTKVTNPLGRPIKCTPEQVSEALLASDGNLTAAATKLGVTRQGVYDYIDRYKLQEVLDQSREKMADEALWKMAAVCYTREVQEPRKREGVLSPMVRRAARPTITCHSHHHNSQLGKWLGYKSTATTVSTRME